MKQELNSLVRKLDRKADLNWVEEMRLGKPAYDHLIACVRADGLTRNQLANALRALFRLRLHGSEEEVFALLQAHTSHHDIRVRTEAVKLLIGLMKLHNLEPPFQLNECVNEIRAAIELGLYRDVASLARDFVTEHT